MTKKSAWTPVYWDDWIGDTQDLSLLEHGAYFRLMAAYYASGGELSADRRRLYRICGALEPHEQEAIDLICGRFFRKDGEWLRHDRADRELAKAAEKRAKAQAAAAQRHGDNRADGGADAHASASANANADGGATRARVPQPTTHNPDNTTQNPETTAPTSPAGSTARSAPARESEHDDAKPPAKINGNGRAQPLDRSVMPSDLSPEVLDDWLAHRRRIKCAATQTVLIQVAREIERARRLGWEPDEALAEALTAGWRGLKATWLENRSRRSDGTHQQHGSESNAGRGLAYLRERGLA